MFENLSIFASCGFGSSYTLIEPQEVISDWRPTYLIKSVKKWAQIDFILNAVALTSQGWVFTMI